MELVRRFFQAPKESFFLFGPRGTGKSTWLRRTFPDAKACLLYGGKDRLEVNGVLCLPCEEFLRGLLPDSPAPVD